MSDVSHASIKTRAFGVIALSAWALGVILGLSASPTGMSGYASDALLLGSVFASSFMVARAAIWSPRHSVMRAGWVVGTLAIAGAAVVGAVLLSSVILSNGRVTFDGASPAITAVLLLACVAMWTAALGMRHAPHYRADLLLSLGIAAGMWVLMIAAFLAPGPAMPMSIGPRDPIAILRVTLENLGLLWPALLCTCAALRLTEQPRARAWVWVTAGVVILSWGDVVNPLVDLGSAQFYPAMLWCLGIILVAMAASRFADCELSDREAASPA